MIHVVRSVHSTNLFLHQTYQPEAFPASPNQDRSLE